MSQQQRDEHFHTKAAQVTAALHKLSNPATRSYDSVGELVHLLNFRSEVDYYATAQAVAAYALDLARRFSELNIAHDKAGPDSVAHILAALKRAGGGQ